MLKEVYGESFLLQAEYSDKSLFRRLRERRRSCSSRRKARVLRRPFEKNCGA